VDQQAYRRLISEGPRNVRQRALLAGLRAVAGCYGLGVGLRNWAYDRGLLADVNVGVPVISVGNLTTGGTGKTPLVVWLYERLTARGRRCGILTRGYKTTEAKLIDEPAVLLKSCPQASVVVDPDRVAGARRAIDEDRADVLILDDGLQHRRIHRDLNIVTVDATCPFGYGRLLPAGLLREPVEALKRADAVVVTHYDHVTDEQGRELLDRIGRIAPEAEAATAAHVHPDARLADGRTLSLDELRGRRAFVFCGIGNPDAFVGRLERDGLMVVGRRVFNDHHDYTSADLAAIHEAALREGADLILCTQKDWDKVISPALAAHEPIPLAYVRLRLEFIDGADRMEALIDRVLGRESARSPGRP